MRKKFTGVEFRSEYPGASVADHEIFMSFDNDSDAEFFRKWWEDKGAELFHRAAEQNEDKLS